MTNDDYRSTSIAEHGTHLSIEDTTHGGTGLSLDVNTLLVQRHMAFHIRYMVRTEVVHNPVTTRDWHGQAATIALKIATQLTINR